MGIATQIVPHGKAGLLVDRVLDGLEREQTLERAERLRRLVLDERRLADVEMIATGAMSPLTGFMRQDEYRSVVERMRLPDGTVWTIPVTLPIDHITARRLREGEEVALSDRSGEILAVLTVEEVYGYRKQHEAKEVYGTDDAAHPGVDRLYAQGERYVGGTIRLLRRPEARFPRFHRTPAETRALFASKGWRRVVGFQTRNPVHRAHEYIQKCALETVDGLLLHPLVGETKGDDISASLRMESYHLLLSRYYPADRAVLSVFPAAMRYAGPREAVFHALCRKNYGCTHFVVGRDHAGVGNHYGTYASQHIFDQFEPGELGITPLRFEHSFYCNACGSMASGKTCPHPESEHVTLSGSKVRAMLREGHLPPPEFTRPEVAKLLSDALRERGAIRHAG